MPARPFPDDGDEASFRADFIRSGYAFALAATGAGLITVLAFMLVSAWNPVDGSDAPGVQALRMVIALACATSFGCLLVRREWALANYYHTVFIPALVALIALSLVVFVPRPETPDGTTAIHGTLTLIIAIWIISAFCRLSLLQVMAISLAASALNLLGLSRIGIAQMPFLMLDLIVANGVVWALAIQTEKRERLLWFQANRARRALRHARDDKRRSTIITQVQSRLLRTVGHDIRQPLVSGGVYLGMLNRATAGTDASLARLHLDRLSACLRAIDSTLDRLLEPDDPSGIDNDLSTDRIDVSSMLADVRDVYEPQASTLQVRLHFTRRTHQATAVRTSEHALREVLGNLVANAIKYADHRPGSTPWVLVGVVHVGDMVRIDIVDNGIGIPAKYRARVFEEGFRVPISRPVRGMGLGLAIVESTIQRLPGHRLQLSSTEGRGTRMRLYLPAAQHGVIAAD